MDYRDGFTPRVAQVLVLHRPIDNPGHLRKIRVDPDVATNHPSRPAIEKEKLMRGLSRERCLRCYVAGAFAIITVALLTAPGRRALGLTGGDGPNFVGASAGNPIPFDVVPLPPVMESPHNDPPAPVHQPFIPSFGQLVNGEIVIRSHQEMRHVWRRLFDVPYNASLFDFDSSFVVMMGNGLNHPGFGFDITDVEQFEAMFEGHGTYLEYALAIVGTATLPGPPPPPKDPVYHVSAVRIARDYSGDILFSRQVLAAP